LNLFLVISFLAVLTIGIVFVALWVERQKRRRRKEDLRAAADAMGLEFMPTADDRFARRVAPFRLFNKGHDRKILNIVVGQTDEFELTIFDYHYTTGGGEHQQRHRRSVTLMESPELRVPAFSLRPESVFDKLGAVLGLQDIDFDSHPVFSKNYLLKGEDEAQIREFFNDALLVILEQKEKICMEAVPGRMICYYPNRPPSPDQLKSSFAEALQIFNVFAERARSLSQSG
jgi:hypothetical protein